MQQEHAMIKLRDLLAEKLHAHKSTYGEYIRIDFKQDDEPIGYTNIRLKRGWNQLHVDVASSHQGHGYAKPMIAYNIKEYDYVVFPHDRITNPAMHKVIAQFRADPEYQVFDTSYDETVIANHNMSQQEILSILS